MTRNVSSFYSLCYKESIDKGNRNCLHFLSSTYILYWRNRFFMTKGIETAYISCHQQIFCIGFVKKNLFLLDTKYMLMTRNVNSFYSLCHKESISPIQNIRNRFFFTKGIETVYISCHQHIFCIKEK
jgi:hypothetical protein